MKNLLNFILCLIIAVFLTLEISGTGGVFIITLMLTALTASAAVFLLTVKFLSVSVRLSTEIVNKGESLEAVVTLDKKMIIPTCFVQVELGFTPNLTQTDPTVYKSVCAKRAGESYTVAFNAELAGAAEVCISSVTLFDYMGIFRKKLEFEAKPCSLKIIPHIPDTGSQTEVLRSTSEKLSFDDSDEESDESSAVLTGVPGYEHRAYVVGDPLKRINWKLSSKREELMVRLDEKVTSSSQIFLLDYPYTENAGREYYKNADKIIESCLAMLEMLVKAGFESEFNFFLDGWQMIEVKDLKTLRYLQEQLAGVKPYPVQRRFPDSNINTKGKAQICFTVCTSDMKKQLAALLDSFDGSLVVTKRGGVGKLRGDMWSVSDDFEFAKM